jgi:dolichyl-phosphate-mannose--protein O-mannosyl transferase
MFDIGPIFISLLKKIGLLAKDSFMGDTVKYRDTLKLKHVATESILRSIRENYTHEGTSGQQVVTAAKESDTMSYWVVKGPHNQPENYKEGTPIKRGDIIRLEHLPTRGNLHSHHHSHEERKSPISRQNEVTVFGKNSIGDDNDNWRVEVQYGKTWYENIYVKLIHVDTNYALHSHNHEYTTDQKEVTCFRDRDDNDWWVVIK